MRSQNQETKVKPEKRVKRERSLTIVDDDDDDDDADDGVEVIESVAKRRRTSDDSGVEIVDLTDD